MALVTFERKMGSYIQEWNIEIEEPIHLLSEKECSYINKKVKYKKFSQPGNKWFRKLIGKFRAHFSPQVAKFLNKRNGKVITTMQLQEEFNGSYYINE